MPKRCPQKEDCCKGTTPGPGSLRAPSEPPEFPQTPDTPGFDVCEFMTINDFIATGDPISENVFDNPNIYTSFFQQDQTTFTKNAQSTTQTVTPAHGVGGITPHGDVTYMPTQAELDLATSLGGYSVYCVFDAIGFLECTATFQVEFALLASCPCDEKIVNDFAIS